MYLFHRKPLNAFVDKIRSGLGSKEVKESFGAKINNNAKYYTYYVLIYLHVELNTPIFILKVKTVNVRDNSF